MEVVHPVNGLYFGNTVLVNSGSSTSYIEGKMSSTEKGEVYVVWVDKNNVYFSALNGEDINFSNPIVLNSNNTVPSSPQLAATEKGDVYVVWVDKNNSTGASNIIFRASNDSGSNFERSVRINRNVNQTSAIAYSPQLAVTEKGDVYVVWVDKNNSTGASNIIFRASNDSGSNFERSVRLNRNIGPNQTSITAFSPQLAVTGKGDVYVVWVDKKKSNGDTNISFVSSNTSGNDFTNRKNIRSNDQLSFSPQLAATEKGEVYVVWVDKNNSTGASNIIFRASNDSGSNFERSVRINRNAGPNQTSAIAYSPQLAVTEKGDVYVVWVDKNNSTGASNIIFRASNDNGNNFERSTRLNRNSNLSLAGSPHIAATENGNVFATWSENTVQFKEILDYENIFGRPIAISSNVILPSSLQIDVTHNGNIYLAWAEKRDNTSNASSDIAFVFKKISESYFDRN